MGKNQNGIDFVTEKKEKNIQKGAVTSLQPGRQPEHILEETGTNAAKTAQGEKKSQRRIGVWIGGKRYIRLKSKRHPDKKEPVQTGKKESFAKGLNFYKLFWVFFIGAFIGVVVEVIFCLIVDHHYESRKGVIYGPFNPVYGFGAVLMTMALYWLRKRNSVWIFVCGAILGAAFEYICSWYQETFLGTVSWDYSDMIGNIGGRTSLLYALFWGTLAIAWMKLIYPFLSRLIEKIPNRIGKALTWVLAIFMAFNCLISAAAVNRMSARHEGVEARSAFDVFLDETYPDEFLTQIYTHMAYSDGTQTDAKLKAAGPAENSATAPATEKVEASAAGR